MADIRTKRSLQRKFPYHDLYKKMPLSVYAALLGLPTRAFRDKISSSNGGKEGARISLPVCWGWDARCVCFKLLLLVLFSLSLFWSEYFIFRGIFFLFILYAWLGLLIFQRDRFVFNSWPWMLKHLGSINCSSFSFPFFVVQCLFAVTYESPPYIPDYKWFLWQPYFHLVWAYTLSSSGRFTLQILLQVYLTFKVHPAFSGSFTIEGEIVSKEYT